MRLVDLLEERAGELSLVGHCEPVKSSHSLHSLASSPTLMTPKGSLSPTRRATSPVAPFKFSTCSEPPPSALKSVASVSSKTCAAERPWRVEVREPTGEEVLAVGGYQPLIEHAINALDALRPIEKHSELESAGFQ